MATTTVPDNCYFCSKKLESGDKAIYVALVSLTKKGRVDQWWNPGPTREVKKDKLRIRYYSHSNPKNLICQDCWTLACNHMEICES